LLGENPHVRAQDLADGLGMEKAVFKNDVRKLKELGLTISHSPGYELSPRGKAVLSRLPR
jgi:Mn-dependent DtxR family transcriptional regulator